MKWVALALAVCVALPARAQEADGGVVIPPAVVLDGGYCLLSPERCVATGQELAALREANRELNAKLIAKPVSTTEAVVAFVVGLVVGVLAAGVTAAAIKAPAK